MKPIVKVVKVRVVDHEATGAAMRNRRRRLKLTLLEVAVKAGISISYLSALEAGNRPWTQHLCDIVDAALKGYYQKLPKGSA
jgi:transcriptional regulator with XRE-family HTH domain